MSFMVTMTFPGEELPSVPPLAVQWDRDGAFVWKVTSGAAERVPVAIHERGPDAVLVEAALVAGDLVAVEGVQRIRAGAQVAAIGPGEEPGGAVSPAPRPNS